MVMEDGNLGEARFKASKGCCYAIRINAFYVINNDGGWRMMCSVCSIELIFFCTIEGGVLDVIVDVSFRQKSFFFVR